MSLFATKKIVKEKGVDPEPFELDVAQVHANRLCLACLWPSQPPLATRSARLVSPVVSLHFPCPHQALCDLEANSNDLKAELRELYIVSAKEVDVTGRKAVVIFVPFKLLKVVHKIQSRLVRELEKKFSGKHVVLIGQRRIMRKPSAGQRQPKQKRPVSRTLTAVHEAILEDLVYPTEIVGKHTRYRLDGSKICKVYLDPKEAPNVEYKVDTFATVYKKLTGKEVKFEFPSAESH